MSDYHVNRRSYIKAMGSVGTAGLLGLAGCSSIGGGGGPIPMGSIMPITGQLSPFGQGMQAAVELAEEQINEAGGPLGREISVTYTNSETSAEIGQQRYNQLVNEQNIVGFVGAASSGVSTPIAESVAADGVMQVSHASTSPALAEIGYGDDDELPKYFGRTAPNDGQQGTVMGQIMNSGDYIGADSAAFLHVDNPYGAGLAQKAANAFDGDVLRQIPYQAQTSDYSSTLDTLFQGEPDAVGFVGYPENGRTILQQWADGGYGGQWVLSEGLNSPDLFSSLTDIVSGMYVASPDPEQTAGSEAFIEATGGGEPTLFAPHAYDALFLECLAMHVAGEASGTAIAENIRQVSSGSGDTTITVNEFSDATDAIDNGESINYQGASSPVDFNSALEPLNRFAILQVQDDGSTETLETIPRSEF